jgi:hypothetical protein
MTLSHVMAGLRPGHPRLSLLKQDVDARNKSGHDAVLPSTPLSRGRQPA